jgi:hypothetical protein
MRSFVLICKTGKGVKVLNDFCAFFAAKNGEEFIAKAQSRKEEGSATISIPWRLCVFSHSYSSDIFELGDILPLTYFVVSVD